MRAVPFLRSAALFAAVLLLLPACDTTEDPTVADVFVIGTRVPSDFLSSGRFELVATALDEDGEAILTPDMTITLSVLQPTGTSASGSFGGVNEVSGDPLAVSLVLDGSGSMSSSDPGRLRVDGAQAFVERLSTTPDLEWEASVYTYSSGYTRQIGFSNDVPDLFEAIDRVGQSGGTDTYETLLDVLLDGDDERPRGSFEPAVVLLSDGYPSSVSLRDEVCGESIRLGRPVYSIGLGPASDLSDDPDPDAVEEMREIARCTNSVYAGIAAGDPTAIERIYASIATATAQGSVSYDVTLSGAGFEALDPGDTVQIRVTLASGGGTAGETFSFTAPFGAGAVSSSPAVAPDAARRPDRRVTGVRVRDRSRLLRSCAPFCAASPSASPLSSSSPCSSPPSA